MDELNLQERLLLANQFRILERLDPEDAVQHSERREALERGYVLEYGGTFETISPLEMSEADCRLVMNVFDLFSSLQNSHAQLNDTAGIDSSKLQCRGFDGNNESELRGYALYLRRTQRWEKLLGDGDLNSHEPTRELYGRMLERWNASVDKDQLTKDDILRIIA